MFGILLSTRFEAFLELELMTSKVNHVHFQVLLLLGELAGKPEPAGLLEVRHHQVGNPLLYFLQDFLSLLEIFGIISWIDTVHETLKGISCPNPRSIVPFLAQVAYLRFKVKDMWFGKQQIAEFYDKVSSNSDPLAPKFENGLTR